MSPGLLNEKVCERFMENVTNTKEPTQFSAIPKGEKDIQSFQRKKKIYFLFPLLFSARKFIT
jgi:hypothetical protein